MTLAEAETIAFTCFHVFECLAHTSVDVDSYNCQDGDLCRVVGEAQLAHRTLPEAAAGTSWT